MNDIQKVAIVTALATKKIAVYVASTVANLLIVMYLFYQVRIRNKTGCIWPNLTMITDETSLQIISKLHQIIL